MTIIEVRPFRNGWEVYESAGEQPVFLNQEDAISYAKGRAGFRYGDIRILDCSHLIASFVLDIGSKTVYCGFLYNSADTKWDFVSYITNF